MRPYMVSGLWGIVRVPTERRGGVPYRVSGLQVIVNVPTDRQRRPLHYFLLSEFCALSSDNCFLNEKLNSAHNMSEVSKWKRVFYPI